ncbi:MAG: HAMP domain-containing protein [Desulfamplus sp.]|nr:HAMP domain-containing protein [Desulfamplus sp.]
MKIRAKISDFMQFESIERRLSAIAVLFIMGTAITMGCMGIWLTHKFVKQRFHDNFIVLADYLARNAELGVLLKNRDMLQNLTTNMLQQEDILKVIIKDADGRVIVETGREETATGKDISETIDSAIKIETRILQIQPDNGEIELYDVKGNTDTIGYVELYYTPSGLRVLTKNMTFLFMAVSLILSSISFAWYWFFARSITAPLINLVAASKKVSQGDFDVRASGGNLRETKTLAKVFNEMLNSVKAHQQETEKMHIAMAKQKSLAEIGKFSTMVAHELKNPISIIKGSMDIFKKKNIDDSTKESMIVYVDEEIQRLNRLVDEFLLFAKPKTPVLSKVFMLSFLSEVTEKLRFTVPDKNIKISLNVEDAPVECDLILMERALLNILKNAVEHSVPNHSLEYDAYIDVHGKSEGAVYIIEISDRGKGIDETIIDDIFNPFFTTRAKGTGLGLAIVKEIVAVHNGTVVVRNRPSGGASFQIKIMAHAVPSFFLK